VPSADPAALNAAARRTTAACLAFLDARARPREGGWLAGAAAYAQLAGVGAVGGRILGPDGRPRALGFTLGTERGRIAPVPLTSEGEDGDPALAANRWAVGGGLLVTPRAAFEAAGGFDEALSDPLLRELDYCRRLAAIGWRSVYAPGAVIELPEDATHPRTEAPAQEAAFRRRHGVADDPYRSPHLSVVAGRTVLQPRRIARHAATPVRALMCSFNLNREGAASSQYELILRLAEAGVLDPVVFSTEDGPLRRAYEERGIEVRVGPHPLSGVFDEAGYERAIAGFADTVRAAGARLVYGNTAHTFYAIAAAEKAGVASVWNPRESEPPEQHFRHFGPAVAARALDCFRLPYRVVFVAEATRAVYRPLETAHNFTVIHNGLDRARLEREAAPWTRAEARRALRLDDDEVALLVLGTVCERKGQADLPAALRFLPARTHPRVRALIVGDRGLPYSRRVEAARDALPPSLRARVALLPETDDPARFYRAADVFVCTSRVESFPRVTLEAMAHGLPLVTTPVFGIREQVREGVNALLYETGDAAALGAALGRLVEDGALRARLAENARPVLECLNDFEAMAQAYAAVFREAAETRAPLGADARP
jgi:glycosyltransferase involved in cell wall biosynthesis